MADRPLRPLITSVKNTNLRAPILLLPTYSKVFGESQTAAQVFLVTALVLVTANAIYTARVSTRSALVRSTRISRLLYVMVEIFNVFKTFPLTGCTLSTVRCYTILLATGLQVALTKLKDDSDLHPAETGFNILEFIVQSIALPGLAQLAMGGKRSDAFTTAGAVWFLVLIAWITIVFSGFNKEIEEIIAKEEEFSGLKSAEEVAREHWSKRVSFVLSVNTWLLVLMQYG